MAHTPYGYKTADGKAVIEENQAAAVRELFEGYIFGLALKAAAEKAGLKISHCGAGRMLRNKHYLGYGYYPKIIDKELFDKAEKIRMLRAKALGRIRESENKPKPAAATSFSLETVPIRFTDPFAQAEYAYSLIESEVVAVD